MNDPKKMKRFWKAEWALAILAALIFCVLVIVFTVDAADMPTVRV